jgi:CHAD domain-containing protein
MATTRHQEIERKYDVQPATVFPNLVDDALGVTVAQPVRHELRAVYFDTSGLDLVRRGVTLRRRTGGDDAGWHLKVPGDPDSRIETRLPLGSDAEHPPTDLLDPVRAVVRDLPLVPVARVSTRRLEYPLVGGDGRVLAHVCDDEVEAERLGDASETLRWREWEVELAEGDLGVLDTVESRLLEAGAAPAAIGSKLARVLGDGASDQSGDLAGRDLAEASAGELVRALLSDQVRTLQDRDAGVRAGRPDSIHKLRIAARRLRSTLTTCGPIFDAGVVDGLREELRWLGQELAEARDAQVLREHLQAVLADEPTELVIGPVARRIDDELRTAYRSGLGRARRALDSERYFRLLDALDQVVAAPALRAEADEPARAVLQRLLARDAKRLRKAVRAVSGGSGTDEHDLGLHEARKKAKRLRYAAESAVPVFGGAAEDYARRAKKVQKALGVHQDAVVARRMLREYGVAAHLAGENAFSFGRLHGLEQGRALAAERAFRKAWKALPHKKIGRLFVDR